MEEKNNHILKKAIRELPQYSPNDSLWAKVESRLDIELSNIDFENELDKLPELSPAPDLWDRIEQELESDSTEKNRHNLTRAISELPYHLPPQKTWRTIESSLPAEKGKIVNLAGWLKPLSIAASLAIVIAAAFLIRNYVVEPKQNTEIELAYSTEVVLEESYVIPETKFDEELNDLIKIQCNAQPDICTNPEFVALSGELIELTQSIDQLTAAFNNSNEDPETYKYILRAQKEKAEISKKLIQRLNS